MNQIGKILVVFIAVASIAFMGFATVITIGGYNFEEHIDLLNNDYRITNSGGEEPTWTSARVIGEDTVHENPSLPAVLDATYTDAVARQNEQIEFYEAEEQRYAAQIAEIEAANEADLQALRDRSEAIRADLEALRDETAATSQRVQMTQDEVLKLQVRLESRRTDVLRLEAQYAEIAVDEFRAREIIDQLSELIYQVDGELERARRREAQLREQGATLPEDEYISDPDSATE
jgi:hypothetical protein